MRIAILGNAGSGKSTLARWIAGHTAAPLLDLDTVAWEPNLVAVARPAIAAEDDVRAFCSSHATWVVEGCYANLVLAALEHSPTLVFLNPGRAQCLANCRARPWEPHKYASKAEQDQHLSFLLAWVGGYYTRDGEMSLASDAALFAAYEGRKHELTHLPALEPPSPELLALVAR